MFHLSCTTSLFGMCLFFFFHAEDCIRDWSVTGVQTCALPILLNVTADRPDGTGFVTVYPCGGSLPLASNLNFVAGQTVANSVTVAVGVAGKVCIYTFTATHIVVDVGGAFRPALGTGLAGPVPVPSRLWG